MMMAMLIAGIGLLLGGLLTVGFGIELDLSFGNTLIQSGSVVACTGILLLGLWTVVRELKNIARRLGPEVAAESRASAAAASATLREPVQDTEGFLFGRDQPNPGPAGDGEPAAPAPSPALSPAPWHEETAARDRARSEAPAPAETAPAVKPRRNLLFSSSSRKERERAEARTSEPSLADSPPAPPVVVPPPRPSEPPPPVTFEDAWPQTERPRTAELPPPPPRRPVRTPSTFTEPRPVEPRLAEPRPAETGPAETSPAAPAADRYPPAARPEDQPPVTVLKSGVVDGMAYSLYSDGSIEAQMPEGMMRFASIDELRTHLDQRP
jgi:hypothetical protein